MSIKKGFKFDIPEVSHETKLAEDMAKTFVEQLNLFHAQPSPRDSKVDLYLHQCYADVLRRTAKEGFRHPDKPYFSPSSSGSCPRELYLKIKGEDKDAQEVAPHQTRWQHIGTKIGDMIQEQVLLMENHLENLTQVKPKFKFVRNEHAEPMFEEFAYNKTLIKDRYYLMGTTDGIMYFEAPNGEVIKVGLEIKSKQTTYSQTGGYSMKDANPKHKLQTVAYSIMYDVDYWIIVYVNASKKSWNMTEEDVNKYPDIRAFGHYVTQEMKDELLGKFEYIMDCVDNDTPPKLELENWTFNNYKRACALDLSQEEFVELIEEGIKIVNSNKPAFVRNSVEGAIEYIDKIREEL
jgi:hypothetical protein